MEERNVKDASYLEKGYKESHAILLRLAGMYVPRDKYEKLNWIYVAVFSLIYLLFFTSIFPDTVLVSLPVGDLFAAFQALFYAFTSIACWSISIMYLIHRESVEYCLIEVGKGYYQYDEEEDEDALKVIRGEKALLEKVYRTVSMVVVTTGAGVLSIIPIVNFVNMRGEIPETAISNPYLPLPFVSFWDVKVLPGYLAMFVLIAIGAYIICTQVLGLSLAYTCLIILFRIQFVLLNLSISKMEERADKRFVRAYKLPLHKSKKFSNSDYQECLYFCLRENIRHHQCLLRWMKEAQKFMGWALLLQFAVTSTQVASATFLLSMAHHSIFQTLVIIQVVLTLLIHSYVFCWWGQNLAVESSRLPTSLYSTPWIYSSKKFKQSLIIIFKQSSRRVIPFTRIFNKEASLETYASIMSSGYSYFNLLRSINT